jgi:hypothetical protein
MAFDDVEHPALQVEHPSLAHEHKEQPERPSFAYSELAEEDKAADLKERLVALEQEHWRETILRREAAALGIYEEVDTHDKRLDALERQITVVKDLANS